MTVQMPSEAMMALIVKKYISQEKNYTIASTTGAAKYQLWQFVNLTNRRAHIFFVKTPHVWVQKRILKGWRISCKDALCIKKTWWIYGGDYHTGEKSSQLDCENHLRDSAKKVNT